MTIEPKTEPEHAYGAEDIQVLEGLEAVRKRPGMYIGSTGPRGLHHLVYEIVDNSVDEALAGYCDTIDIRILADGAVRVQDNGRGIPVDIHKAEGKSTVEVVLTVLHAGGKFGGGGYAVSGGLHGVGSSVVNALSSRLEVEVRRQGYVWRQSFHNGVPNESLHQDEVSDETGTTITFWPSSETFETIDFDYETLRARFQQMAFLNKGLRLTLTDERPESRDDDDKPISNSFLYEQGDELVFMNTETYEQLELQKEFVGDRAAFLQDGMMVTVELYGDRPIGIRLPDHVVLTIAEADPVVRGQTAASSYKPAILENGIRVLVPPFIAAGERILVDTNELTYMRRAD